MDDILRKILAIHWLKISSKLQYFHMFYVATCIWIRIVNAIRKYVVLMIRVLEVLIMLLCVFQPSEMIEIVVRKFKIFLRIKFFQKLIFIIQIKRVIGKFCNITHDIKHAGWCWDVCLPPHYLLYQVCGRYYSCIKLWLSISYDCI